MGSYMSRKLLAAIIFLTLFLGASHGEIWTVNETDNIQEVIDRAKPGDTIVINQGVYYANIEINKPLDVLGVGKPILDGLCNGSVIVLRSDRIVIDGFLIMNSSSVVFEGSGIEVHSSNNAVRNNEITNCMLGLNLSDCRNNTIDANSLSNNDIGIFLKRAENNIILDNIAAANEYGILIQESQDNVISSNNASRNDQGIMIQSSSNNTFQRNIMSSNRLNFDAEGENYIDTSNLVDGKAVYYLVAASNRSIEPPLSEAGIIYCLNSNNIIIRNQSIANSSCGVYFDNTTNSIIDNCSFANNTADIIFKGSNFNTIRQNNVTGDPSLSPKGSVILDMSHENVVFENSIRNGKQGLYLLKSHRNNILNNKIINNYIGASIHESRENIIQGNSFNFSRNEDGIFFSNSYSNVFENNDVQSNGRYGINLEESSNNSIRDNRADFNTVCGINMIKSYNNSIINNSASYSVEESGMGIIGSSNNTIRNNQVSHNERDGIRIIFSSNNSIQSNQIYENGENGLDLSGSNNNKVEDNNISMNLNGLYAYNCTKLLVSGDLARNNSASGFALFKTTLSELKNNTAENNRNIGFQIESCANNDISSSLARNNMLGMVDFKSKEDMIAGNDFIYNRANGVSLEGSLNASVFNNTIVGNAGMGIVLFNCENTTAKNNTISNNSCGVGIVSSLDNNILQNNYNNNILAIHLDQSNLSQPSDAEQEENLSNIEKQKIIDDILGKYLKTYKELIELKWQASKVETNMPTGTASSMSSSSSSKGKANHDDEYMLRPSVDAFDQAEKKIKDRLTRGKLAHSNITQMSLNQSKPYIFEARIAINETDLNLTRDFSNTPSSVQGFDVSEYMDVTLAGDGFIITPQSSQRQQIPKWGKGKDFGLWLWNVKPICEGVSTLVLTASAVIEVDNHPERVSLLETKRVLINVTVDKKNEIPHSSEEKLANFWDSFYARISALIGLLISLFVLNEKISQWRKDKKTKI